MDAYNLSNIGADQYGYATTAFSTSARNASHVVSYEAENLLQVFPSDKNFSDYIQSKDGGYQLLYELPGAEQIAASAAVSVADMVSKIKDVFGLSVIQIAELVGVSRPSIYNHISGKESAKFLDSYKKYFDLADLVQAQVKGDVKSGLKSVLVDGKTLLTHLKSANFTSNEIVEVCHKVADKVSNRKALAPTSYADQVRATRLNTVQG